ncbi:MAG TPA: LuxR family transcriptional regulator [Xanthobacteraceae bacterium]|nr:LuxR family transcriptional regulator [Xanthobacteraceae bacterium]
MKFAQDVFDFIENLERLPTIGAVMDATSRMLGGHGFANFAFSGIPQSSDSLPGVVLAHCIPAELFKVYVERRYADIDPSMRQLRRTTEPFKWLDVPHDGEREPQAAELARLVTDFGLAEGFFVPIPSPAGNIGNVWMAGPQPDLSGRIKPALHLMALYAFDRVHRLAGLLPAPRPRLTAREREVLAWTAAGKSAWEIGEILGIAKRTVDEHAQSAFRKLGAANRAQAIAIAVRERLINI